MGHTQKTPVRVRIDYLPSFSFSYFVEVLRPDGLWHRAGCRATYWGARFYAWRLARRGVGIVWESD